MSDFVLDDLSLPDGKVDGRAATGPAIQNVSAAEWNQTCQAVKDLRTHLKPILGKIYAVSDLPGSTLAPSSPRDTTYTIRLTGNVTIANPTGTVETGSRVRFVFHQDGTGGRKPTWGNQYNATRFAPRQGPNQSSAVEFVKRASGAWDITAIDGIDNTKPLLVEDFGAIGDDLTDDTAAIQAAINHSIYTTGLTGAPTGGKVIIGPKAYRHTGLHLGYGTTYSCVHLEGHGYKYAGTVAGGSCLRYVGTGNNPALSVQGARGSSIRGISIQGAYYNFVNNNNYVAMGLDPTADDTVAANWHDPSGHANQDSRYCPFAAVTIDAYSGTRPATSYPDVNYPSFLGAVAQYGKSFSSDVTIEDCEIRGFPTAIAVQPSDADGNGDFTTLRRLNITYCKWGVSIGNTQSRNVAISDVKMGVVYCGLTNNQHGRRSGKFQGRIEDFSFGGIKSFEFGDTVYAAPITFKNFYCEATWKIGDVITNASGENGIIWESSHFSFDLQENLNRGTPTLILGPLGQQDCGFVFRNCTFSGYFSVMSFGHRNVTFEECSGTSTDRYVGNSVATEYKRYPENFTCGGFVLPYVSGGRSYHRIKYNAVNLGTGARSVNTTTALDFHITKRSYCIPAFAHSVNHFAQGNRRQLCNPYLEAQPWDKSSSFSSATLVGKTLTLTFNSLSDYGAHMWGLLPGDIIWDSQTGSVFFIRSRVTTTVIAELQNNFKNDGLGSYTPIDTIDLDGPGYWYSACTRWYMPEQPFVADLTSGNATLANVMRADGYDAAIESSIEVGDRVWADQYVDRFVGLSNTNVTARANGVGSGGTITLGAGVNTTVTKKHIPFLVRTGAANA